MSESTGPLATLLAQHRRKQSGEASAQQQPSNFGYRDHVGRGAAAALSSGVRVTGSADVGAVDDVGALDAAVVTAIDGVRAGQTASVGVAARLESKFGLGESPAKRRELFRRLERLVDLHGDRAYECIAAAVASASTIVVRKSGGAGRYFCKCVLAKLRESDPPIYLPASGGGGVSW